MSMIQVEDCQTAADVIRVARERAARRREWDRRPAPPPEPPIKIEVIPTFSYPRTLKEIVEELTAYEEAERGPIKLSIKTIIEMTAQQFGVSPIDITSARRTQNIVVPRQLAMYLAKTFTGRSLPEIGRQFGGRDHTTVLHSVRKIDRILSDYPEGMLARKANQITGKLLWPK